MRDSIPDTQRAAYEDAQASAASLREAVVTVLTKNARGLTADEIALRLGSTPFAIRPRVTELKQAGRVVDTGARRSNLSGRSAIVVALA